MFIYRGALMTRSAERPLRFQGASALDSHNAGLRNRPITRRTSQGGACTNVVTSKHEAVRSHKLQSGSFVAVVAVLDCAKMYVLMGRFLRISSIKLRSLAFLGPLLH